MAVNIFIHIFSLDFISNQENIQMVETEKNKVNM